MSYLSEYLECLNYCYACCKSYTSLGDDLILLDGIVNWLKFDQKTVLIVKSTHSKVMYKTGISYLDFEFAYIYKLHTYNVVLCIFEFKQCNNSIGFSFINWLGYFFLHLHFVIP